MEHAIGSIHAPAVLEEYGDYECPWCARAEPVIRALRDSFGPRVRFVFRNFPITSAHPHAERAAEAAEAAGSQGRFWEMHDLLFDHPGKLLLTDLVGYASRLGLDVERFEEELTNRSHLRAVAEDLRKGKLRGVEGTPAFFINGEPYEGDASMGPLGAAIQRAVDEELIRKAI